MARRNHLTSDERWHERWHGEQDPNRAPWGAVLIFVAALAVGCAVLAVIGWDEPADGNVLCANGGNLRPYAGLDVNQLPCLLHTEFDGAGHAIVSGYNPSGINWTAATFHVPNPDQWLEDQELTDQVAIPPGDFGFVLNCAPGAAQVDIWLPGQEEPYAAATTLNCGEQASFSAPAPDVLPSSEEAGGGEGAPAVSPTADVAPGGQGEAADASAATPPPPAAIQLEPTPEVEVLGVVATRALADTGVNPALPLYAAALLAVGIPTIAVTRRHLQKRSGS